MYMGHLDEAQQQFLILKENKPDSIDPYLRLATIYEMKNDLDKALQMANKLIDIVKDRQDDVSRYYLKKVQILRRRKEPEEAIKVLKYIADKYNYPARKKIFDVYLQAGMYKEAEKELWKWKWDGEYYDAQIVLNILKGNYKKAEQLLTAHGHSIDKWRYRVLVQLLARAKEDYAKEESSCKQWLELNSDIVQVYGHLSYCMFHQNNKEKQHEYAHKALEENEKKLEEYSTERTLYETRKYRLLTLLGRMKEAEELSEKIRKMPLCENCPYATCKDLEVFVMEAAEIMGDKEKALLLSRQGNEEYPDEEDFVIMKNVMERKEKEQC